MGSSRRRLGHGGGASPRAAPAARASPVRSVVETAGERLAHLRVSRQVECLNLAIIPVTTPEPHRIWSILEVIVVLMDTGNAAVAAACFQFRTFTNRSLVAKRAFVPVSERRFVAELIRTLRQTSLNRKETNRRHWPAAEALLRASPAVRPWFLRYRASGNRRLVPGCGNPGAFVSASWWMGRRC